MTPPPRTLRYIATAVSMLIGGLQAAVAETARHAAAAVLPPVFETARGRSDTSADFIARIGGMALLLDAGGMTWPQATAPLRIALIGSDPRAAPFAADEQTTRVNYFVGNDPARWLTNVATYARVGYRNVYPGIDLVYHADRGQIEFDFVVAAGADPHVVGLAVDGAAAIGWEGDEIVLTAADGATLRLHQPSIYQDVGGTRRPVAGSYSLDRRGLRLALADYDRSRPLVIDPVVSFARKIGGRADDSAWAIAIDGAGSAYITGDSASTSFAGAKASRPRAGGPTDVFVAKLAADGTRLDYLTFLGGGGSDVGYGIAVDAAGAAYVTGDTRSRDFPVVNPVQSALGGEVDVFIAKLAPDGARLVYSTYYGGSGGERGNGIAVDGEGNAMVAGYTNSTDFPTRHALQPAFGGGNADAFVLKLDAGGREVIYATYLGGANDRPDIANAIAVDAKGNAYVTGLTNAPDFPNIKPLQKFVGPTDAFVTKLDPKGAPVYSTWLGGSADDQGMGIAVDAEGSAYVTGHTESPNFPTTAGAFAPTCVSVVSHLRIGDICVGGSAFVTKINAEGSAIVYSTYLNGRGFDVGRSIAVDAAGRAYVAGITNSSDFPVVNPLQPRYGGGPFDGFLVKFNPGGDVAYATWLGGSGADAAYGVAADKAGNAYVAGYSESNDFLTAAGVGSGKRETGRGSRDAFIVKIADPPAR